MTKQCKLRCKLASHPDILLPDGEEILVGRSKFTKIQDESCSRQQVSFKANYMDYSVEIKQLGVNPSGLDGFSMQRNSAYKVSHGTSIEILLEKYPHIIEFDPPPDESSNKRKPEDDKREPSKMAKTRSSSPSKEVTVAVNTENIWENVDNGELYIFTSKGVISTPKIAAYDLDGTIIKTRSGNVHPTNTNDWQIAFSEIHAKLRTLYASGYKIVFLTNQAPIGKGRVKIEDFQLKLESIVDKLSVPVQCFIATGRGMYRKPMTGMWDVLVEEKNDGIPIDMAASFYCGDAAGRINNWAPGKKKDHSLADRLLADNVGLKFYTPEEHFLGHPHGKAPVMKPEFDPKNVKSVEFNENLVSSEQEILVLVGFPGSGKSFLAKQIAQKSGGRYVAVCRDDMGSWNKCATEAKKLLKNGKSVIVDSTNPDEESRGRWVSLARESGARCRCAVLNVGLHQARHNNKFRELLKVKHMQVADVVFHSYKNKFKQPSTSEGFKEIIKVEFSPTFDSDQSKKLYCMHLLEK